MIKGTHAYGEDDRNQHIQIYVNGELKQILLRTLQANGVFTDVHLRLIVSRGQKRTPYQHPQANIGGPMIVVIHEYKVSSLEALILDVNGFVSTCNSTNFFIITGGEVWTSSGDFCLNSITRKQVIAFCHANRIPVHERNFSLVDVYHAQEAFVTGIFAGTLPVVEVNSRQLSQG